MLESKRKSKAEIEKSVMAILLDEDTNAAPNTPMTLPIADLVPFANHPFKSYEGDRLGDMVRSIRELGVILPIIVRPNEDETYEILSGHNRVNAAKIAELTKVPAIIMKELTDEEAMLIVTETNLIQRSFADLSHSQRAIALKHHLDAIKAQGKRTDLINEMERLSNPCNINENGTSGLIDPKLEARDKAAEKFGLDARTVSRYIRLCELNTHLLQRVDSDEIGFYPAVSLSYLSRDEQTELDKLLNEAAYKVDMKKAESLRKFSESKKLTHEKMIQILSGELNKKSRQKIAPPLKIKAKIYQKYFDGSTPQSEIESVIDQALAEYFKNHKIKEVTA